MKLDIKNIVNTLSSGISEIKNTSGTVNIREAFGEVEEEAQPEETVTTVTEENISEDADVDESGEEDAVKVDQQEAVGVEEVEEEPEEVSEETVEPTEDQETSAEVEEPEETMESEENEEIKPEESSEVEATPEVEGEETKRPSPGKEKIMAWGRKYGWLTGIAASFLVLIVFMVVYTTMTPREIIVTIDGEKQTFVTEEYTVEGFLEDEKIEFCDEDYISVSLTTYIQDNITFELKHAMDFTVTADGETKTYKTLNSTVQQALNDAGIEVGKLDIVKPKPGTMLEENMSIVVKRVIVKTVVVEETVPFKTREKDDVTLNEGTSKVVKKGKKGRDKVTYKITYVDGKETRKKEVARETIRPAVDKVIANGTRVNYNGRTYSRKLVVKAYSYTGGGTTAMGTRARVGEIAVDPSVIPLGTNVYIEGVGPRRAEDTGGNIKGNTIDIYMDTVEECINWGVRYVTIYIE